MMMKQIARWLLAGSACLALSLALVGATRVNPRKGKVFFKKYCRTCHDGSGEITKLEPITKTMAQWSREFEQGHSVELCLPRVVDQSQKELTAQDLLDIQSYLVQHAADSDQPATCGN